MSSAGCCSWCSLLVPWKTKSAETKSEVSIDSGSSKTSHDNQPNKDRQGIERGYICRGRSQGGEKILLFLSCQSTLWRTSEIQKLSENNTREVVPPTAKYITATGKQGLILLQSAATVIPVPLIQEAIKVAIRIIEVCEVCIIPSRRGCKDDSQYIVVRMYLPSSKKSKICRIGFAIWWLLLSIMLHPRMKKVPTR